MPGRSSVTLLPLATVFALEFTMPAWVALLAIPLLGERMTVSRAGSIVLGFVGVLIIVRPGLEAFRPAVLLVLACAVGFADLAHRHQEADRGRSPPSRSCSG